MSWQDESVFKDSYLPYFRSYPNPSQSSLFPRSGLSGGYRGAAFPAHWQLRTAWLSSSEVKLSAKRSEQKSTLTPLSLREALLMPCFISPTQISIHSECGDLELRPEGVRDLETWASLLGSTKTQLDFRAARSANMHNPQVLCHSGRERNYCWTTLSPQCVYGVSYVGSGRA